jgi:hypothetical protein
MTHQSKDTLKNPPGEALVGRRKVRGLCGTVALVADVMDGRVKVSGFTRDYNTHKRVPRKNQHTTKDCRSRKSDKKEGDIFTNGAFPLRAAGRRDALKGGTVDALSGRGTASTGSHFLKDVQTFEAGGRVGSQRQAVGGDRTGREPAGTSVGRRVAGYASSR